MAAEVEGDDAFVREPLGKPVEAEAVGVDAVQADDRSAPRVAPLVRVEDQSSVSSPPASSPVPEGL